MLLYIHGSNSDVLRIDTKNGPLMVMPLPMIHPLMYQEGLLNVVIPERIDEAGVIYPARAYRIAIEELDLPENEL